MCLYSRIYLIWHLQDWRGAGLLNIPFVNQNLCWPEFLQVLFSLCFFIPYLVMNRASCAAIMILRLVALPGFLIISSVSGIVNVMSLIVPAAPSFTYYGFCGSHYNSSVGSVKSILLNPFAYTAVPDATGLAGRLNTQSSARRLRHRCRLPELGFQLVSLGASCVILNGKPMG